VNGICRKREKRIIFMPLIFLVKTGIDFPLHTTKHEKYNPEKNRNETSFLFQIILHFPARIFFVPFFTIPCPTCSGGIELSEDAGKWFLSFRTNGNLGS